MARTVDADNPSRAVNRISSFCSRTLDFDTGIGDANGGTDSGTVFSSKWLADGDVNPGRLAGGGVVFTDNGCVGRHSGLTIDWSGS